MAGRRVRDLCLDTGQACIDHRGDVPAPRCSRNKPMPCHKAGTVAQATPRQSAVAVLISSTSSAKSGVFTIHSPSSRRTATDAAAKNGLQ